MSESKPWLAPENVTICGQNSYRIEIDELIDVEGSACRDVKSLMQEEFADIAEESLDCLSWMTKLGNEARAALRAAKGGGDEQD